MWQPSMASIQNENQRIEIKKANGSGSQKL